MRTRRAFPARVATTLPAAVLVTLWPAVARADMVWPGILLQGRLFSWWAVGAGLVLEAVYVGWRLEVRPAWRALLQSAAMNGASALLGFVLVPFATFVSIFLAAALVPFGDDVANWAAWAVTFPVATAVNVAIEGWVLGRGRPAPLSRRLLWELAVVNAVTVLLAMGSLWVDPVRST